MEDRGSENVSTSHRCSLQNSGKAPEAAEVRDVGVLPTQQSKSLPLKTYYDIGYVILKPCTAAGMLRFQL